MQDDLSSLGLANAPQNALRIIKMAAKKPLFSIEDIKQNLEIEHTQAEETLAVLSQMGIIKKLITIKIQSTLTSNTERLL